MRQRVMVTPIEELKKQGKPKSCPSFTINKPAQNITPEEERRMLEDLFEEMRQDRIARIPKDHYCE